MECTNAHACVLLSYHPETKKGIFFLLVRDSVLMEIIMDVCDHIRYNKTLVEWNHTETNKLAKIGNSILRKPITFENLKALRIYIKSCCKNIPRLEFFDEFNIDKKRIDIIEIIT